MQRIIVAINRMISQFNKSLGLGAGGTWPGEIALTLSPHVLQKLIPQLKKGIIIVAGTNGKTTTSLMIKQVLEKQGNVVIHNTSGANLLNGITSAFIQSASWSGKIDADWGVFEVDENSLPAVISNAKLQMPNKKLIIVLLNLFRDQLDRYGEVDVISEKWEKALKDLPENSSLVLNADDPLIAHLGIKLRNADKLRDPSTALGMTSYFGIEDKKEFLKKTEHATDSTFCPNCGTRLRYKGIYMSHLGVWSCPKCKEKRPDVTISKIHSPLPGLYNRYNTLAAVGVVKTIGINQEKVEQILQDFKPAFGRQEEFKIDNKKIKIFLSKNPTGFNASLRTVLELKPKAILLVLNDRIPDGRDVSWIWDVDFEMIPENVFVVVSGDRVHDMALRIKYSQKLQIPNAKLQIEPELKTAIEAGLAKINQGETLYILPTYSAMLDVRKIVGGRKIL